MVQIRVSPDHVLPDVEMTFKNFGSGGIRTHAPEETGALNQRLRPLGHATLMKRMHGLALVIDPKVPVLLEAKRKNVYKSLSPS